MRKILASILVLLFIASSAAFTAAQCPSEGHTVILKAPAVSKTSTGELVGVATDFVITVAPGSGHVYVETWPLAQVDMQASARLAAQVAGKVLGVDMDKYDVFIQIKANSPIIGGPSAGGTMTVGIIAALEGWKLNPKVMMTGMINPDGTIGPVGGIVEKASAAHQAGAELFLIPEGQRIQYVQKTNRTEIGGVVEIHSTTEKVDVAKYAKERWGLRVIEIKDIYDAVYYFTGHHLQKPTPNGNVKINTNFLKGDAVSDYTNTSAYYKATLKKLKNSDVNYETYSVLMNALAQAGALLNSSKESLDNGMYYTTLSKDFQARIIVRHVDWYLSINSGEDVEKILEKVNEEINTTETQVSNITIRGTTMLQAVAAAQQRVEDAKSSLDEAWKYYYNNDYWDAIGDASYAYERAKTAVFWKNLGERFAKGNTINPGVVRTTARDYIDSSNLIVTYIDSMYGNVIGNDLLNEIEKAEQYYEDGKYSAALFTAMEARIRAEVFLDTLGIDNETVLMDKLETMKEDARTAIGLAQEQGIVPVLAVAYYEFAESYEKSGKPEDLQTAMIFYQYARETAQLFLSTPPRGEETSTNTTSPAPLPTITVPTSTESTTSTPTPGNTDNEALWITAVVGAFLIGALTGKKI